VTIRRAFGCNGDVGQTATPEDTRPMLTPAEVAELASVSRKTVYREIDRGALPALHVGRQLRIDPADFKHYLGRPR
jgi:excisionase family DNA binding protein